MAAELPLRSPAGEPGPPPVPDVQAKPAEPVTPEAPPDLASWYQAESAKVGDRFYKALGDAQSSIAARGKDLSDYRARVAAAPGVPESPELPETPKAPKITARPFLETDPNETPVQSLNKMMTGLGLMAQMAVGIRGGFPSGALAAYQGALEGWKDGDIRRGANKFQTYLGELKKYDRDAGAVRQKFDDAIRKYGADQDRLKTEFGIIAAEHDLGREAISLAFQEPQQAMKQLDATMGHLKDIQQAGAKLAFENLQWQEKKALELMGFKLKQEEAAAKVKEREENRALVRSIIGQGGAGGPGGFEVSTLDPVSGKVTLAPRKGPEASERKDIAQMNALVTLGNDLSNEWKAKPEIMPSIRQRMQEREILMGVRASDLVGDAMTPEQRTFFANVTDIMGAYRAIRSGLAVTNPEALRSAPLVPDDPGALRPQQLDAIVSWAHRNRAEIGRALESAGRTPGPSPLSTNHPGARIPVIGPNGETGTVPAGTALTPGWRAR